jgi:hypothetical protein
VQKIKARTTQPTFDFEKTFTLPVTDKLIDFLTNGALVVEVFSTPDPLLLDASGHGVDPAAAAAAARTVSPAAGAASPAEGSMLKPLSGALSQLDREDLVRAAVREMGTGAHSPCSCVICRRSAPRPR